MLSCQHARWPSCEDLHHRSERCVVKWRLRRLLTSLRQKPRRLLLRNRLATSEKQRAHHKTDRRARAQSAGSSSPLKSLLVVKASSAQPSECGALLACAPEGAHAGGLRAEAAPSQTAWQARVLRRETGSRVAHLRAATASAVSDLNQQVEI
jgi:hypothetical protein